MARALYEVANTGYFDLLEEDINHQWVVISVPGGTKRGKMAIMRQNVDHR